MTQIHTEGLALFAPIERMLDIAESLPHNGIDTSRDAAERKVSTAFLDRERIFAAIVVGQYPTCERICESLSMDGNTVRPRLWELEGNAPAGKPKPPRRISKTVETYPTKSGGTAHGYRVCPPTEGL